MTTTQPVILDVLTAAELAIAEMRQHGLTLESFEVSPGYPAVNETTRQIPARMAEIKVFMFMTPQLFLRWAEHLQVERIHVHRREMDVCLHASAVRHDLRWRIHGSVNRRYGGGRYLPHLPGITVDWIRQPSGRRGDDGYITLPDVRATFAALGITGGAR